MKNNINNIFRFTMLLMVMLLLSTSCYRDPKPSDTLNRKKFISVLTDIHLAEAMYLERIQIDLDSLQSKSAYLSVLKKHGVTEEEMLKTTLYYSRHPREYDKIYSEVLSQLGSMLEEINGNTTTPADK